MRTLCFLVVALCAATASLAQPPTLRAVKIGSRIDVTVDGLLFTSYRFAEDEKYPFFFPVNGPSGASVTSMRNSNFPHHSSLFFGCDHVNGGNYWQEGLERGRIASRGAVIEVASGPEIVITEVCDWTRPGAESPFRDTRRIVISAPDKNVRQIDFEVTLEALVDVEILKTNHSFFSARMDLDLSVRSGGIMVNAEGDRDEKGTFGRPSAWIAFHGRRGCGAREGLAILQHPENPGYPSPWFTRDYGFFSPTPMFWPADGKSTRLARGERWRLRYRTLVFAGSPEEAGIAARFAAYAATAAPPLARQPALAP